MHPYRYEIEHIQYPAAMFFSAPAIPPRPFDETPFTWVDTLEAFNMMLDKLRIVTELALDLEHHGYRTYSGFLCLMQISTREQDWIIDTLLLREELVELNEVFTNPKIVKVCPVRCAEIID
jgi:exosome complex exonuclease RRP6